MSSHDYASTIRAIESKGYKVEFVPIQWERTTIDDWSKEFSAVYGRYKPSDAIIAGFSYGAMTALKVAAERVPSELWLFSLSPYFSEDIPNLKLAWLRTIGKQRQERFSRLSFNKIAPEITCKTRLFIGELEASMYPDLSKRTDQAHMAIKNSKLIKIPGCGHDVTSTKYIKAIKSTI